MTIHSPIEKQTQSVLVLANAAEIVSGVIRKIAGNDISNSLNGTNATVDVIQALAYQSIGKALNGKDCK